MDTSRTSKIFNSNIFEDKVHVIGVGATGSKVVVELIKLGVIPHTIHVYDFDRVEDHNICNQAYREEDVGKLKVDALCEICKQYDSDPINICPDKVTIDSATDLSGIVFLLTDTMESRREIFNEIIELDAKTNWLIETRMGVEIGTIFTINPILDSARLDEYKKTLEWKDDDIPVSACGTPLAVGATSSILASLAVWQFIRCAHFSDRTASMEVFPQKRPEYRIIFSLRPYKFVVSKDEIANIASVPTVTELASTSSFIPSAEDDEHEDAEDDEYEDAEDDEYEDAEDDEYEDAEDDELVTF